MGARTLARVTATPAPSERYDAIAIGSGQGGTPLAEALAHEGWRVALIERHLVGGTCVNVGCTPTKTMVASGRVAYLARRAADYGVRTGPVSIDMAAVRARKRAMVGEWHDPKERRLQSTEHLDLIYGEARFTGPHDVEVALRSGGTRRLTSERIFLNTGCRSARPPLPGLDSIAPERVLDSTSIMELGELPDHLIVLGGGYIGLEFGQMFRRFGSRVTVVQRGPQLLGREDQDVAEAVASIMKEDGIEILLEADAVRAAPSSAGVSLSVRWEGKEQTIDGSHLLLAAGRVPNSDALNLPTAGIETDRAGFIKVNDRLETNVHGVWAIGDVKGGPAFTHISYHDSTIVLENVLHGGRATVAGRLIPYVVYIDPQLGRVGLAESEARASGRPIKVARMNMEDSARASEMSELRGFMKAILDAETGQMLGCAVLGLEGGEIMSMLEIAMLGKLPYTALRDGIFAHPTLAESLNSLFYSID